MQMNLLRVGMRVRHSNYGEGQVFSVSPTGADIDFGANRRHIPPTDFELSPAEPVINVTGLDTPLPEFIKLSIQIALRQLGIEPIEAEIIEGMAGRWHGGKLVITPADSSLQPKEIPLDSFFHKIVMLRNNLRVLEQKINAHSALSDAEKVEFQQYITRCYGTLTTFNVMFRDKKDQFRGASSEKD
jgi:hypothetical protein